MDFISHLRIWFDGLHLTSQDLMWWTSSQDLMWWTSSHIPGFDVMDFISHLRIWCDGLHLRIWCDGLHLTSQDLMWCCSKKLISQNKSTIVYIYHRNVHNKQSLSQNVHNIKINRLNTKFGPIMFSWVIFIVIFI